MKTIALIMAAGRGSRVLADGLTGHPKQYRNIGGKPLLRYTLNAYASHPEIDFVLTVIHPDDVDLYEFSSDGLQKLYPAVFGGATRQSSVLAGLNALIDERPARILIHDGARPFVSHSLISRVVGALDKNEAVLPVCPVTDTLRRGKNNMASDLVSRDNLYATQTPQGFHFETILSAHQNAAKQSTYEFTDDGEIARWAGVDVALVEGDAHNVKITHQEDFEMANLRLNPAHGHTRTGQGFDVHAFGPGNDVTICGVNIPHHSSLKGHSDADVGLHALTDAILGAICAGDIGTHFPPDDAEWQGANSAMFLKHAANLLANMDGRVEHVDVTIICEAPKIGPHREAMRTRIAEILELELNQVSVKATTTEKLGFTGRREGIAAQAVATIYLL